MPYEGLHSLSMVGVDYRKNANGTRRAYCCYFFAAPTLVGPFALNPHLDLSIYETLSQGPDLTWRVGGLSNYLFWKLTSTITPIRVPFRVLRSLLTTYLTKSPKDPPSRAQHPQP